LWVLDVQDEDDAMDVAVAEGVVDSKPGGSVIYPGMPF
jgi:uncharacterized protein (UPF0212 family)